MVWWTASLRIRRKPAIASPKICDRDEEIDIATAEQKAEKELERKEKSRIKSRKYNAEARINAEQAKAEDAAISEKYHLDPLPFREEKKLGNLLGET